MNDSFGSAGRDISTREKLILSGLYLSKYSEIGLRQLGFESYLEAFNVIGYALGSKPASVKNYRDEFDPLFPNNRKGWHKRSTRAYCLSIYESYRNIGLEAFTALIVSFFGDKQLSGALPTIINEQEEVSSFAQRLITGLAAERYFESVHADLPEFRGRSLENTTRLGCGYDFRLHADSDPLDYLAVEVKGLNNQTGSLSMTSKEYDVASSLRDRFFLFVVRNFREAPTHNVFRDPLASSLTFKKIERMIVQTSWLANITS